MRLLTSAAGLVNNGTITFGLGQPCKKSYHLRGRHRAKQQIGRYTRKVCFFIIYLIYFDMSFYPIKGKWDVMYFRKVASTAFKPNNLVAFETNGGAGDPIEPADASDTAILGIGMKAVASTDSDYASNTRIPVLVPAGKTSEMECDDVDGTLVVADEGLQVDLSNAESVNRAASSTDVLVCTKFISATKGHFVINKPNLV
jgi:hypothetical protein